MPVAAVFWSMHTAVVGPVEVLPEPKRIWGHVANYDSDTIQFRYDDGLVSLVFTVRLEEIDGPEMRGKCPEERRLADLAKMETSAFIANGPIYLTHVQPSLEMYGRILAKVGRKRLDGTMEDLGERLKTDPRGIARDYDVSDGRQSWCG